MSESCEGLKMRACEMRAEVHLRHVVHWQVDPSGGQVGVETV